MNTETLYVIKRNGKAQIYNESKIALALSKAFNSLPHVVENKDILIQEIISELDIKNMIPIEEIQNQLEELLMKKAPKVAKRFIIYREEHNKDRDTFAQKTFIHSYIRSINAATGSKYDSNSNVTEKNITTLTGELPKGRMIQLNRAIIVEYLNARYGTEIQNWKFGKPTSYADEYIRLLTEHFIYKHDETSIYPYCVATTMYPLLIEGLQKLGGISNPPKHLRSFCGIFVNFAFTIAAQFAGAVATPEFLMYFDYFCRKEWGDDYYKHLDRICELDKEGIKEYNEILNAYKKMMNLILDEKVSDFDLRIKLKDMIQKASFTFEDLHGNSIEYVIKQYLQNVVYYLNQPAAARNFQCVRENTQLWTPSGYKYLSELKEGDECYVWKDGKYFVEKIEYLNIYDYDSKIDGKLLQFKGDKYQQTVTPNHRIVYKKPNTPGQKIYEIKTAKEMFNYSKLTLPINGDICKEKYNISDDLLKLCTYALTDGSIRFFDNAKDGCNRKEGLCYYMSPNKKGYEDLLAALDNLNINYSISNNKGADFGKCNCINLIKEDAKIILDLINYTKETIPYFYLQLNKEQAKLVIDCWSNTDGQKLQGKSERFLLQCDNEKIADVLQQVVYLAGFGCTFDYKECNLYNNEGKTKTLYLNVFSRDAKRINEFNEIDYKGKVWCPTTKTGIVIFREENKFPYISGNSIFWNIGYFDKYYFEGIFGDFCFPDGTKPQWDSLNWLQKYFMNWFNEERKIKLLTFPVETMACLTDGEENFKDEEYFEHTAEMYSKGHSFFTYLSDSADSLSSCCRLRNEVQKNTFSYSLGAGGVATGSKSVMTININRAVQFAIKNGWNILDYIRELVQKVQCFQLAYNDYLKEMYEHNMLTVYKAGFISLKQQYLTIGVNGVVESAEFLGYKISPNEDYKNYMESLLKVFYEENKKQKTKDIMFNTEFVPGENLGVKFASWDKRDSYVVPRDCYNSYFYIVEDENTSVLDKFKLHGKDFVKYLDGGSALHCNLDAHLSKEQYKKLLKFAVKEGTNYFTFNIPNTICNKCGNIDKRYLKKCPVCGSEDIDYATRVIGYLKRISNFAQPRQEEASKRYYANMKNSNN